MSSSDPNSDAPNPFDEILKQLQAFLQNLFKNSNFNALNFQEMLEQMMRQMNLDPEELEKMLEQMGTLPGFAMSFQLSVDEEGNKVIKPLHPNVINSSQESDKSPEQKSQVYHEWIELPEDEKRYELIVEILTDDADNINIWLTEENIHIEVKTEEGKNEDIVISHAGKFDPKKPIKHEYRHGILSISQ